MHLLCKMRHNAPAAGPWHHFALQVILEMVLWYDATILKCVVLLGTDIVCISQNFALTSLFWLQLAVCELLGLKSQSIARGCSIHCMGLSGNPSCSARDCVQSVRSHAMAACPCMLRLGESALKAIEMSLYKSS